MRNETLREPPPPYPCRAPGHHDPHPRRQVLTADATAHRNQPALRTCLFPGCIRQYDAISWMNGTPPPRPTWSGAGWHILKTSSIFADGGHLCPDHVAIVTTHLPRWIKAPSGRYTVACACGWTPAPQRWHRVVAALWQEHLLQAHGDLPPAPPLTDPEHRVPLAEHTEQSLAELYDRLWDAEDYATESRSAGRDFYQAWQDQNTILAGHATLAARVHNALLLARTKMTRSPRAWDTDPDDAWVYAVLIGWDCEQQHEHTDACPAQLDEMAAIHGWSSARVEAIRKHRAALALAGPNGETEAAARRAVDEEEA
ncbi:hypothetical protein [Streptomyces sp. NPDC056069]|uniref:hypothetical protein n=1 Tax=Streptomyces sp. NPDC056069 TaxID=3345702 RepID=UPI0035D8CD9D